MPIPIHRPLVFLRCKKCGRKTDHVLISILYTSKKEQTEETYECQECGETKTIYELASTSHFQHSIIKLKDPLKKDHTEVTIRKKKRGFF